MLDPVFYKDADLNVCSNAGWNVWQGCWIKCFSGLQEWVSWWMLHYVFERDVRLSDWQGSAVKRLTGLLHWVFDEGAGLSVSQGCLIEWLGECLDKCFTGVLVWVFDRGAGLILWQGCWAECLEGCLIECMTGMHGQPFRHGCEFECSRVWVDQVC